MFRQAGVFRAGQDIGERILDSNPLERERGITILAKNTAVLWRGTKINIVDTPGHADFGGEVERILRMVDGVLLLVDAAEGPMPQTRFVTAKALALGLTPVILINKVDRADARPEEVHDEVLELLMDLDASDAQLDAPFLYAVGREGWAATGPGGRGKERSGEGLTPLFETVVQRIPPPRADPAGPFQMLVSTLDHSNYVGRIAIGRVERGAVSVGRRVTRLSAADPDMEAPAHPDMPPPSQRSMPEPGAPGGTSRVTGLYTFSGLDRIDIEEVRAGDIVGLPAWRASDRRTLAEPRRPERLRGITVRNRRSRSTSFQ